MTDKDIETALAIHNGIKSKDDIGNCLNCPYFGNYTDCTDKLLQDIGEYIKRLTAREKRLKTKNDRLKKEIKHV